MDSQQKAEITDFKAPSPRPSPKGRGSIEDNTNKPAGLEQLPRRDAAGAWARNNEGFLPCEPRLGRRVSARRTAFFRRRRVMSAVVGGFCGPLKKTWCGPR